MSTGPAGPKMLAMQPIDSEHLSAVGHDPKSSTLQVAFKDQSVYQYFGVPASSAQALVDAKSKGSYFNRNIKQKYKSACVKPKPKKQK